MTWYKNLPNYVRAAFNTAWQAFLGTFGVALLGWIADVSSWAGDTSHEFPSISPLGKAVVAGLVAAASFLVTLVVRGVQQTNNPAAGPQYLDPPKA